MSVGVMADDGVSTNHILEHKLAKLYKNKVVNILDCLL